MACGVIRKRRYELFVRWTNFRGISCENRAAAYFSAALRPLLRLLLRPLLRSASLLASPPASPPAPWPAPGLLLRLLLRWPSVCFPTAPLLAGARCRRVPAADLAGGRARRLGRPSSVPDWSGDSSVRGLFCPKGPMVSARRARLSAEGTRGRHAKVKNSVFCFYFLIKDVSLCSQNNTLSE